MGKTLEELRSAFDKAVDDYAEELLAFWSEYDCEDPAFSKDYCYWVGGDKSGVFCYGDDLFVSLADLIFCVERRVDYSTYQEWVDYCTAASEWGFDTPNIKSWVNGCPRVPWETFEKLRGKKNLLDSYVEVVKHNPTIEI